MSTPSPVTPAQVASTASTGNSSVCGGLIGTLIKFPLLVGQFLSWLLDANGNFSNAAVQQVIPSGFLMNSAVAMPNSAQWLVCDGSPVIRSNYPDLFIAIGTTYGSGDGSTTFNLPDARCRFPVGAGSATINSVATTYALGQVGGEATHVLDKTEMPPHDHPSLGIYQNSANQNFQGSGPLIGTQQGTSISAPSGTITDIAGGDPSNVNVNGKPKAAAGHNNIPPFVAWYVYIKT